MLWWCRNIRRKTKSLYSIICILNNHYRALLCKEKFNLYPFEVSQCHINLPILQDFQWSWNTTCLSFSDKFQTFPALIIRSLICLHAGLSRLSNFQICNYKTFFHFLDLVEGKMKATPPISCRCHDFPLIFEDSMEDSGASCRCSTKNPEPTEVWWQPCRTSA